MRKYSVYILRCSDNSLYTGITNNVENRVSQHAIGTDPKCYTFRRRPVTLAYSADFTEVLQAIAWEKTVKRWSRAKKLALIAGEYGALPSLARSQYAKSIHEKIVVVRRAHHDNFY